MPASLLAPDSPVLRTRDALLSRMPWPTDAPGLAQARLLADYVLGRRAGELDVSGRTTDGTVVSPTETAGLPEEIIIVDDAHGRQSRVLSDLARVTTFNDRIDDARTVEDVAPAVEAVADLAGYGASAQSSDESEADPARTAGTSEVWAVVNAPKAAAALAETVAALHPRVTTVIVVGRSEAMSRAVNKELSRGYGRVDVSPGVGKHRLIIGSRPLSSPSLTRFPRQGTIETEATGLLEVRAHGACFSGVKADEGSALLVGCLAEAGTSTSSAPQSAPTSVLDLGCGSGWLLAAALRLTGAVTGVGVDVSRAAVASARETAAANGFEVDIVLADATVDGALAGAFDLILLNPPFHRGTAIETDTATALMRAAAAHLSPTGRVLTVFNSHLRYRDRLEEIIGPSEQVARDAKFTVVASRRPGQR